jgi:hypothetical protein
VKTVAPTNSGAGKDSDHPQTLAEGNTPVAEPPAPTYPCDPQPPRPRAPYPAICWLHEPPSSLTSDAPAGTGVGSSPRRLSASRPTCVLLTVRFLSAALLILLLLPAAAVARATGAVPPGNSAVNQYLEVVPTANGSAPSTAIGPSGSRGAGGPGAPSPLTPAVQRALAKRGSAGRGVIALADSTGVGGRTGTGPHRRVSLAAAPNHGGPGGRSFRSRRAHGAAPLNTLANALTGSSAPGGLGPWLPAVLVVTALGGGLVAALRRRRKT